MIHSIKNNILIIIGKIGQFIYNKIIIYFSRKFIHEHPLLRSNIPPLSLLFLFGGVVVHCAGSLIRVENISNKEFHIIQTLVLVLTLWNCVLH